MPKYACVASRRAIEGCIDDRAQALDELARLIDGISVAMVTSRADDDQPRTIPRACMRCGM
jgi:hypothetical protein